jgi:hypothetical protein
MTVEALGRVCPNHLTLRSTFFVVENFPSRWDRYRTWKGFTPAQESIVLQPYFDDGSGKEPRCYQRNAINAGLEGIAKGRDRILLVMATGTGKTYTAYEIYLGLFQAITGPEERQKLFRELSPGLFDLIVIAERTRCVAKWVSDYLEQSRDRFHQQKTGDLPGQGAGGHGRQARGSTGADRDPGRLSIAHPAHRSHAACAAARKAATRSRPLRTRGLPRRAP